MCGLCLVFGLGIFTAGFDGLTPIVCVCVCVYVCVCLCVWVWCECIVRPKFTCCSVPDSSHRSETLPLVVYNCTEVVEDNILGLNSFILTRPALITCMFMNMPLSLHTFLCFSCLVLSAHSNGFWCVLNVLSLGLRLRCG